MVVKNEYLQEAPHTIYEVNSDRVIREQCIRRKEYDRQMNYYKAAIAEKDAEIAALKEQLHRK